MKRIISLLLVVLLFFTACENLEAEEEVLYEQVTEEEFVDATPVGGGEITIPLSVIDTLNPLKTQNRSYFYFSKLIYESLFDYDEDGNLQPNLVEHYTVSDDGYQISLTLKNDIYWHDGAPLTAEDVEMSLTALKGLDEDNGYVQMLQSMAGVGNSFDKNSVFIVRAYDSRNVDIRFDKPYLNNLEMLTTPILPNHLLSDGRVFNESNFKPIGTGPYQMFQYREGREIVLKSNDRYHGSNPMIKVIRGKIFSDEDAALTAFETGQIDMSTAVGSDWEKYTGNDRIRIFEYPTNEVEMLAMNMNDPMFQGETGKALRQAIYHGINRQVIIDRVFLGRADESDWLLNSNDTEAEGIIDETHYDVQKARALLDEVGLVDQNGDGTRQWLDGNPIVIYITTNITNRDRNLMARYIAEDLQAIGIDARVAEGLRTKKTVNRQEMEAEYRRVSTAIGQGNFQLAIYGVQLPPITDLSQFLSRSAIDGVNNLARYQNEAIEDLVTRTKIRVDEIKDDEGLEEEDDTDDEMGVGSIVVGGGLEGETSMEDLTSGMGSGQMDQAAMEKNRRDSIEAVRDLFEACEDDPAYVPLLYKRGALLVDHHIFGEAKPTYLNVYKNVHELFIPLGLQ